MTSVLKAVVAIAILSASVQTGTASDGQSLFDKEGHFIACQYYDGTMDQYTYDAKWRMDSFRDRDKVKTNFIYSVDGTMKKVTAGKSAE